MKCLGKLKTTLLPVATFLVCCQINILPILAKEEAPGVSEAEREAAQGNWNRAVTLLTDVCKGNGEDPVAFYDLGVALFHQGKLPEAQTAVDIALKIDPHFVSAYIQLATIKAKEGDYEGAQRSLGEALLLEPNNESAKSNLKSIMEMESKPGTVSPSIMQEALNKQKSEVQPPTDKDNMEIVGGMPALVARATHSTDAESNAPSPQSIISRASAPYVADQTKPEMAQAQRSQPESANEKADDINNKLKLGFAALNNKNWQGAAYIYGEIVKINDNNAQAWLGLGLARYKLNDKESALKSFQRAIALAPKDVAVQAAVQFAAEENVQTGHFPEASNVSSIKSEATTLPTMSETPPQAAGKIGIGANSDSL